MIYTDKIYTNKIESHFFIVTLTLRVTLFPVLSTSTHPFFPPVSDFLLNLWTVVFLDLSDFHCDFWTDFSSLRVIFCCDFLAVLFLPVSVFCCHFCLALKLFMTESAVGGICFFVQITTLATDLLRNFLLEDFEFNHSRSWLKPVRFLPSQKMLKGDGLNDLCAKF